MQLARVEVEHHTGVEVLAVDTHFEVQVCRGGSPCASGQSDRLARLYPVAGLHQVLGVVAIDGLQPVVVTNYDHIAVGRIGLGHAHDAVEGCHNRVVGTGLDVVARMMPASASIWRDYLTARQREGVFLFGDEGKVDDLYVAVRESLCVFHSYMRPLSVGELLGDGFARRMVCA